MKYASTEECNKLILEILDQAKEMKEEDEMKKNQRKQRKLQGPTMAGRLAYLPDKEFNNITRGIYESFQTVFSIPDWEELFLGDLSSFYENWIGNNIWHGPKIEYIWEAGERKIVITTETSGRTITIKNAWGENPNRFEIEINFGTEGSEEALGKILDSMQSKIPEWLDTIYLKPFNSSVSAYIKGGNY